MDTLRKITVQVPEHDLEMAQAYTGEGVTETVRAALKKLASIKAQQELLKLRGTYKFKLTLDEIKHDRQMIAADLSSFIAYLNDQDGADIAKLLAAIAASDLVLPAVVVTEILTDPSADAALEDRLANLAILPVDDGYWMRAGRSRRLLVQRGFKARVGDALIAQSCIDHDVALITRDKDFRHFAKHCGLKLA